MKTKIRDSSKKEAEPGIKREFVFVKRFTFGETKRGYLYPAVFVRGKDCRGPQVQGHVNRYRPYALHGEGHCLDVPCAPAINAAGRGCLHRLFGKKVLKGVRHVFYLFFSQPVGCHKKPGNGFAVLDCSFLNHLNGLAQRDLMNIKHFVFVQVLLGGHQVSSEKHVYAFI